MYAKFCFVSALGCSSSLSICCVFKPPKLHHDSQLKQNPPGRRLTSRTGLNMWKRTGPLWDGRYLLARNANRICGYLWFQVQKNADHRKFKCDVVKGPSWANPTASCQMLGAKAEVAAVYQEHRTTSFDLQYLGQKWQSPSTFREFSKTILFLVSCYAGNAVLECF